MNTKKEPSFSILTRNVILNEKKRRKQNKNFKEFNFSFIRCINNIKSIYSLTGTSFIRNTGAGFFILFFPVLLLFITGSLFGGGDNALPANIVIAGISVSAITGSGLNGLSIRMTQWKESTIIKRIGSMPLKKFEFLGGVLFFYFTLMCFQAIYVLFIGYLITRNKHIIGTFNSNTFDIKFLLGGWLMSMIFSLSLGVFLSTLTRDPNTNSLFGIMIFLPAAFLSGQYVPTTEIDKRPGLHIASEIWPQRYLVFMIQRGFYHVQHTHPMIGHKGGSPYPDPSPWLYICYPLSVSVVVIALAAKLFKWES